MISALCFSISVFGIPEEIISENVNQFTAKEYQELAAKYGLKLVTSNPYYHRGDGF